MPYDSAATRSRLLDAAYREFSEQGLAGARVDRIATAARANKQAIYAYFGSKEDLFDAGLTHRLGELADAVPLTPDDLPGYAGALFDALHHTPDLLLPTPRRPPRTPDDRPGYAGALFDALNDPPDLLRLTRWRGLERHGAAPGEVESHREKAQAIQAAMDL